MSCDWHSFERKNGSTTSFMFCFFVKNVISAKVKKLVGCDKIEKLQKMLNYENISVNDKNMILVNYYDYFYYFYVNKVVYLWREDSYGQSKFFFFKRKKLMLLIEHKLIISENSHIFMRKELKMLPK